MGFLSDLLLAAGAFGAAAYCLVLARRIKALTALDSGLGQAIALLSAQVDDLGRALVQARDGASAASGQLGAQTERAEAACRRLELLVAALHDLPEASVPRAGPARGDSGRDRPGRGHAPAAGPDSAPEDEAAEALPQGRGARILRRQPPAPDQGDGRTGRMAGGLTAFGATSGSRPGPEPEAGLGSGRAA